MARREIKKLDDLFSDFIRKRAVIRVGGCERCLSQKRDIVKDNGSTFPAWKQLQCSHFVGRGRMSTRWDEDNAAGLCGACHLYLTSHPPEHVSWFAKHLGEGRFGDLNMRANFRNASKPDLTALALYYSGELVGSK